VLRTGHLPRQDQIERAIQICRDTKGVRSVRSEIKLGAPKAGNLISDTTITTNVKRKLFNDKEVSGFTVHVETVDGKVYLQGIVNNALQRQRAATLARQVEGVTSVVNLLRVRQ
jgi:osmotically-inducible protein OsmY